MPFWGHLGNFMSSRLGNVFAGFVAKKRKDNARIMHTGVNVSPLTLY